MNTTLTSRILAGGTVAGLLLVGAASGVFGTFSSTILSGNSCSGYGYFSGYGYGYDCTPIVTGGGGGGGGSSSSNAAVVVTTPTTTTPTPTLTPSTTPTPGIVARDISRSQYRTAIETLIQKGVINNATKIAPNRTITRAEFLKLISIAHGYTTPVEVTKKFDDLPSTHTLYNYVNYGVAMGWVNTKHNNFRPNDIITQGEINKLLNAIAGTATADTVAKPSAGVTRGKAMQDIYDAFYAAE